MHHLQQRLGARNSRGCLFQDAAYKLVSVDQGQNNIVIDEVLEALHTYMWVPIFL